MKKFLTFVCIGVLLVAMLAGALGMAPDLLLPHALCNGYDLIFVDHDLFVLLHLHSFHLCFPVLKNFATDL